MKRQLNRASTLPVSWFEQGYDWPQGSESKKLAFHFQEVLTSSGNIA
jgi:hypothetical protein